MTKAIVFIDYFWNEPSRVSIDACIVHECYLTMYTSSMYTLSRTLRSAGSTRVFRVVLVGVVNHPVVAAGNPRGPPGGAEGAEGAAAGAPGRDEPAAASCAA